MASNHIYNAKISLEQAKTLCIATLDKESLKKIVEIMKI